MAATSLASAASALLLMVVLLETSHAASSSAPSSVEYWQTVLPSFPLPEELLQRVSPLDSSAALLARYTPRSMLSSGLAEVRPGTSSLCTDARLYCSSSQFAAFRQAMGSVQSEFRKPGSLTAHQLNKGRFFRERELVEGAVLVLKDQKDRTPSAAFLPRQLANKLYPATATLLQSAFGIPPSSLLAKESIHTSQSKCKADAKDLLPGEEAFCAYSLEILADELKKRVVADASGASLQLLPVSSSAADTVKAKLVEVKLEAEAAQPYLTCHAQTYPFAVYYCHHIPSTRVYSATFQPTDPSSSDVIRAAGICHMDTSEWSPEHVAFADLGSSPGRTEVCHWVHENALVFVATET